MGFNHSGGSTTFPVYMQGSSGTLAYTELSRDKTPSLRFPAASHQIQAVSSQPQTLTDTFCPSARSQGPSHVPAEQVAQEDWQFPLWQTSTQRWGLKLTRNSLPLRAAPMICPIHSYFGKSLQEGLGTYMSLASPVLLPYKHKSQHSAQHEALQAALAVTLGIFHNRRGLDPIISVAMFLVRHLSNYPKTRCHKATYSVLCS